MVSGLTGTEVPRKGLRVRVPCPPLRQTASHAVCLFLIFKLLRFESFPNVSFSSRCDSGKPFKSRVSRLALACWSGEQVLVHTPSLHSAFANSQLGILRASLEFNEVFSMNCKATAGLSHRLEEGKLPLSNGFALSFSVRLLVEFGLNRFFFWGWMYSICDLIKQ